MESLTAGKRKKLQSDATLAILDNSFTGIICIAPRVGKSKIICDAIKPMKTKKFLITAPYNTILESWKKEFEKWRMNPKNITLINQRSLSKEDLSKYDVIICDEVHTLSDAQMLLLKDFKGRLLGASGSISKETEKTLKLELGLQKIFEFTIEQAIEMGIVADYEIILVPVTLDATNKYIEAGSKDAKFLTTEYANYQYHTTQFEKFKKMAWNNKKFEFVKMAEASRRAELIYKSRTKIERVKKLIKDQERCLIFTARTEVADEFATGYHSKANPNILTQFMDGELNKLAVCEMTNMGVTFPNLKTGIFHQMRSGEESAIQKVMRMCNVEEDEKATLYIVYYANTVDEEWTKKALIGLNPDKIKII
jgi:superfamily II DNA or RNA helicase